MRARGDDRHHPNPLEVSLDDGELREEINVLGELMVAGAHSEPPLSDDELDAHLGLEAPPEQDPPQRLE